MFPPDTSELTKACNMLRQIYNRKYGRGWREAVAHLKRILDKAADDEANYAGELEVMQSIPPETK